jgi:hypothetical protein
LDCGEVYEYVATVFTLDETITLFCVEPFHFTLHAEHSLRVQMNVSCAHNSTIPPDVTDVNCNKSNHFPFDKTRFLSPKFSKNSGINTLFTIYSHYESSMEA